jgi:hypothetical protein
MIRIRSIDLPTILASLWLTQLRFAISTNFLILLTLFSLSAFAYLGHGDVGIEDSLFSSRLEAHFVPALLRVLQSSRPALLFLRWATNAPIPHISLIPRISQPTVSDDSTSASEPPRRTWRQTTTPESEPNDFFSVLVPTMGHPWSNPDGQELPTFPTFSYIICVPRTGEEDNASTEITRHTTFSYSAICFKPQIITSTTNRSYGYQI